MRPAAWTIGHSNRSPEAFVQLLTSHGIEAVADVRRYPGSRRSPHFSGATLAALLPAHGVTYVPMPELGGRRTPRPDSPNTAWRSAAFRGYADFMMTDGFAEALDMLVQVSCGFRTAMMCAEAVWWRCHRGLIADALCWAGFDVHHILGPSSVATHPYTAAARLVRGRLTYAASAGSAVRA